MLIKSVSSCFLIIEYFYFNWFSQSYSTNLYNAMLALASITLECAPSWIDIPRNSLHNFFNPLAPLGLAIIFEELGFAN